MKFGQTEEKTGQGFGAAEDHTGLARETLGDASDMHASSENDADVFQAELYNAGKRLLARLDQIEGTGVSANRSYAELVEKLKQLRDFHFNIGFAGGMSSGKSTVINSLIEYPLMPTCKLTTTCVGTHLFYGEKPRISVVDDDTGRQVLNVDCANLPQEHFRKLKEYACVTTHVKIIENLQHFTDHNLFQDKDSFTPDMLQMDRNDSNHVILLLMILLTVYVDQNSAQMNQKTLAANKKREEVLKFFGFDTNTVNYTIQLQWNGELLKSGMTITDLPGLGAYAPDRDIGGRTIKGHDTISTDAVKRTDAMVFLVDPQVDGTGVPALQAMISNAELKGIVNQSDLIIPVLNKVDDCSGTSEIRQAVDKFVDILKNTGVKKSGEDVHLYSAWYGEYKFGGIPDDRTCFYFRNYSDFKDDVLEDAEEELNDEQLHRRIMAKSRKKLAARYQKAGIEELKLFFRAAYVGKSKDRRSQAAIFAVRQLALDTIVPMKELIKNCDVLRGVAGSAIEDISKGLKTSVDGPISQALGKIAEIEHDDSVIRAKLAQIPEAYSEAFFDALEEYKARNLAICRNFTCAFGGFSDNARIDQACSPNQMNYAKLREQLETLGIDVKNVNQAFAAVLQHVTEENQSMYQSAVQVLEELRTDIPKALDSYVACYRQSVSDECVLGSVTALRDTLVQYMQQQLEAMLDSMKINQSNLAKAGNDTLERIFELNTRMANLYTKSVLDEVRASLSNGIIFSSREYIRINGSNSVKQMLANLNLSADDRQYIEDEVRAIGIMNISNNLDSWYQDTENTINLYFTSLREQLRCMMDDTVRQLSGDAEQIAQRRDAAKRRLKDAKAAFCALRESVQARYDASVEGIADETLRKYRGDILSGIAADWKN